MRLTDGGGLYLEVSPNLSRGWFWKYSFDGKEKRIALGHYTEVGVNKVVVSLKAAREARDDARKVLRSGTDPAQQRQLEKLARQAVSGTTFAAVARELHTTKCSGWSPRYAALWIDRMEKDQALSGNGRRGGRTHESSPPDGLGGRPPESRLPERCSVLAQRPASRLRLRQAAPALDPVRCAPNKSGQ